MCPYFMGVAFTSGQLDLKIYDISKVETKCTYIVCQNYHLVISLIILLCRVQLFIL